MAKVAKETEAIELSKLRTQQENLISQLDKSIEELKYQFQLFFNGERKPNIPPEKEREELQKTIRNLSQTENRSPHINMLTQNLISKFTLYNNMWLRKMNELELGLPGTMKKPGQAAPAPQPAERAAVKAVKVNLNDERSFEKFYQTYCEMTRQKGGKEEDKETVINTIKSKLIFSNLIIGKVELTVSKGKVNLKVKE